MKVSLRLCLTAAIFTSTLAFATEDYESGKLALEKNQIHSAIHYFHTAMMTQNDLESMHELLKLREDHKLEQEFFTEDVVKIYIDAIETQNPVAYNNLGSLYLYGYGVKQDFQKAWTNYNSASLKGDARGHHNLGYMYHHGIGVEVNRVRAKQLYQQAANKDYLKSKGVLARDFTQNLGSYEDETQPLLSINIAF